MLGILTICGWHVKLFQLQKLSMKNLYHVEHQHIFETNTSFSTKIQYQSNKN